MYLLAGFKNYTVMVPGFHLSAHPFLSQIILFYFLVRLGFELRAFTLAGQALYHLSHSPSSFCFSYFLNKVSHLCQS
jgi:hypothetical protein